MVVDYSSVSVMCQGNLLGTPTDPCFSFFVRGTRRSLPETGPYGSHGRVMRASASAAD
jgi:hypothetical protein